MLASLLAAGLLLLQAQALDKIVVTTAPPLDAQRLADALRVYLGEFGIAVDVAPPDAAGDLEDRIAGARRLGESVRAVAVIHAQRGTPDEIEIELSDLATDKTLIAGMPRSARDEDLYRTLALKVQAMLRATLSEARDSFNPGSAVGRLVSEAPPPPAAPAAPAPGPLQLQAGYGAFSFAPGTLLQGLAVTGTYSAGRRVDVALSTALLSSTRVSSAGVDAVASLVPVLVSVRFRWRRDRLALSAGPGAELGVTSVTAISQTVRSSRDILVALGAEGELSLRIKGPAWTYLRAGAFGVIDGPRYDIEGVPVLDTSRLQVSMSAGLGVRFP